MRPSRILLTVVLLITVLAAGIGPLHAQEQETVLQLAVPGYLEEAVKAAVEQFEADHPGVRVDLVTDGSSMMMISMGSGAGQGDIEDVLDEREDYASSADVLAVSSGDLSPEITRAHYFLDLMPLVNGDPDLNSADFYNAVWQAFQWEGGFWALPIAADPILLFYDKAAFDAAGLPYPDTWRTFEDVENAIRALTPLDADGKVAARGYMDMANATNLLLLSLLGQGVVDDSVTPGVPNFNSPELEHYLTLIKDMKADGLFDPPQTSGAVSTEIVPPPLQIGRSAFSFASPDAAEPLTPVLLPGGHAGLDTNGFAVSSGTQFPELAYELAKTLTAHSQLANSFAGATPARRSLAPQGENANEVWSGGAQSSDIAALLPVALDQAYPASETRFSEYLNQAIDYMLQNDVDASQALMAIEEKALARLQASAERGASTHITVQPPQPAVELAPGEIALRFGISSMMMPLPNQEQWDAFAADFAARDPEVGLVQLDADVPGALDDMVNEYDCFLASSSVAQTGDLGLLRSLDPLMAADPTYDPADMVNGVMQQLQRDDQTWGMPITIQPMALRFNSTLFEQAGAVDPVNGWSTEDFEYALEALKTMSGDSEPFVPRTFGNTHLLMLIAAYGGLPLDFRTNPVTINFTDPNTVAAIQRVLDLAKNGYIAYSKLASSGATMAISIGGENNTPLYTVALSDISGAGGGVTVMAISSSSAAGGDEDEGPVAQPQVDPLATFPQGSAYTAMSYDVGAAYISANTQATDACYRFISELSQHADLMTSMPARRSVINDPDVAAVQGQDTVAFYQTMDALLSQPNTVIFPNGFNFDPSAMGTTLLSFWLNRAFDRYVTEGVDLQTELAAAEQFTRDYQQCAAAIPPYDPTSDDFGSYYQQFTTCAVQVDPSTADTFQIG
ncbi:MAG TPA: extracellular solute-binding protein [Aggregatilinea sp.]|uniref:ABC transporter substrate-binding protein n=1 Tax=Aggregatilinea sp. TaxID=2806333 RepID=UPI002BC17BBC|nr:extracellular solute-binding protein [Aggregatilinea sp.]HML21139.1 extracellular solute-binding protein [Aggregatilinea sp.]